MWTVAGKSLFSILFVAFINLALSANQPTFKELEMQNKCMPIFLKLFDGLDKNNLTENPTFQRRFAIAKETLTDPFCRSKLSSLNEAKNYIHFIWRNRPEFVCHYRSQETSLTRAQAEAACATADAHDILTLENRDHNVLILGETHIKDVIAAKRATQLLKYFPFRGIEGFSGNIDTGVNSGLGYALATALTKAGIAATSTTYKSLESGYYFGFDGAKDILMINQVRAPNLDANRTNPFRFLEKLEGSPEYPVTISLERSLSVKERIERECPSFGSCPKRTQLLIYLRNSDMANTIAKILKSLPKNQDLLVIVGARHVEDLAYRISCQNKMNGRILSSRHQDYPMTFDSASCQRISKI